jgi:hypothetical protein
MFVCVLLPSAESKKGYQFYVGGILVLFLAFSPIFLLFIEGWWKRLWVLVVNAGCVLLVAHGVFECLKGPTHKEATIVEDQKNNRRKT